jgi:hypothetical protein
MDEAELIAAVRIATRISDQHPDYTATRIRTELTDALRTAFVRPIKSAGAGYAQQLEEQAITSDVEVYRIPKRAVVAGLVTVEAKDPGGFVRTMVEVSQREQAERIGNPGEPAGFIDQGDYLRLCPASNIGGWMLRQWYKLRPSRLVEKQTAGLITAINLTTREITVNSLPLDRDTVAAITDTTLIDVVAPDGSHEAHLVSAALVSVVPLVVAGTVDLSRIRAGDYVRAEDQSDWPMLPPEFHRTLADAAAVVVLSDMGIPDKAEALAGKVKSDIERMKELMEPRVRDLAHPIIPRFGALRASRLRRPPLARL